MIRFRNQKFNDYFIDKETAVITDIKGNVVPQKLGDEGRPYVMIHGQGMRVHQIQAHTAYGYIKGYNVHHIDENKLNNSLSNLAYISSSDHGKICHTKRKHHTIETKKKLSELYKGRKLSEETKKRMSEAHYGKYWWNNGIEQKYSKEPPSPEWIRGRLKIT